MQHHKRGSVCQRQLTECSSSGWLAKRSGLFAAHFRPTSDLSDQLTGHVKQLRQFPCSGRSSLQLGVVGAAVCSHRACSRVRESSRIKGDRSLTRRLASAAATGHTCHPHCYRPWWWQLVPCMGVQRAAAGQLCWLCPVDDGCIVKMRGSVLTEAVSASACQTVVCCAVSCCACVPAGPH